MTLAAAAGWVAGGALYARLREGRFRLTRAKVTYSLACGLLVTLIVNFLVAAVARGEASVVIPVANLSFVAAMLLAAALGMERLTRRKALAAVLAIMSVFLLSRP